MVVEVGTELVNKINSMAEYVKSDVLFFGEGDNSHQFCADCESGEGLVVAFPDYKGTLVGLWMLAERFNFNGIGLLVGFSHNNQPMTALQLDMRSKLRSDQGSRWVSIAAHDKTSVMPLSINGLKKHRVLL
jgi:hypothetical protein